MKKLSLLFGFLLCLMFVQAQQFVQYSADNLADTVTDSLSSFYLIHNLSSII